MLRHGLLITCMGADLLHKNAQRDFYSASFGFILHRGRKWKHGGHL